MYMSRIRGPYVRFCERDEVQTSPYSISYAQASASFHAHIVDDTLTFVKYFDLHIISKRI